jgi:hypothetical protein
MTTQQALTCGAKLVATTHRQTTITLAPDAPPDDEATVTVHDGPGVQAIIEREGYTAVPGWTDSLLVITGLRA